MRKLVSVLHNCSMLLSLAILPFLTGLAGCSGGSTLPPRPALVSIAVSPATPSVALGLAQQFAALAQYSDGTSGDITNSATWTSATPRVASVSSSGLAASLTQGTSIITATSGSIHGSATFSVTAPVLASISVTPATASIPLGSTQQFAAVGVFTDKSQQALTGLTWSSATLATATVSASGLASTLAVGTSKIIAASGSISGSAVLTVTPPILQSIQVVPLTASVVSGKKQQFTASGTYSDGTIQSIPSPTWSLSDPTLASVSSGGLVSTMHPGSEIVTAASGSVQGNASLTITPAPLTGITVTPASSKLQLGTTTPDQLTATGTYADSSTADISSQVSWSLANPYIATIDSTGAALPQRAGFTKVIATLDKLSGSASLTVLATPRFLYEATDSGRDVSRLILNAATGQPRHWGYQTTNVTNNQGFACISADPSNQFAYVTNVVPGGSAGSYITSVSAYTIDPVSGNLTPAGNPYQLSASVGCLHFEPSGNFAFASPAVEEGLQQIVTLAKSSAGVLSVVNTTLLPDYVTSIAIDPGGRFLYAGTSQVVSNAKASAYGFTIDAASGLLTPIDGTPLALPVNTWAAFSFNPSGDSLYLSDTNGTNITGYTVDSTTGALTAGAASIAPCINPAALSFSPDGTLAFVACGEGLTRSPATANLVSMTVGANGSLTQASVVNAYLSPQALTVDPSGQYLYVISSGNNYVQTGPGAFVGGYNCIVAYNIHADGTVSELNETSGRNGQFSMILLGGASPVAFSAPWLFLTDSTPANSVNPVDYELRSYNTADYTARQGIETLPLPFSLSTLPWGSDLLLASPQATPNVQAFSFDYGTTTLTSGSSLGAGTTPGSLLIDPSGVVAFSSEPSTGLVYWHNRLNSVGQWVTPGSAESFSAGAGAGPMAIDPSGRYLFVGNQTANSISEFQYAGAPPVAPFALSTSPLALATDPSANFLCMAGKDNMLHIFSINVNGDLTENTHAALLGTPASVAIEPTGHFVYVAGSGGLDVFAIDPVNFTLKPVTINVPISLTGATGVYADPTGKKLYVLAPSTTYGIGTGLYGFTINSDGTLTALSNITLEVLSNTTSVAFQTTLQ